MSSTFLQSMAVLEGARAAMKVGAVREGERVGFICDRQSFTRRAWPQCHNSIRTPQ